MSPIERSVGLTFERDRTRLAVALTFVNSDCADRIDDDRKREIADILCKLRTRTGSAMQLTERIMALRLDPNLQRNPGPKHALERLKQAWDYSLLAKEQMPEQLAADKPAKVMYTKLDMGSDGQSAKAQSSFPFEEADEKHEHWEALTRIIRFCNDQDLLIATLESEGLATRASLEAEYNRTCYSPDSGGRSIAIKTFEQFMDTERIYFARVVEYLIKGEAKTVAEAIDKKREASSRNLRSIMETLRNKPR